VRHKDEEVKQTSEDDGGGLFEEAGEHERQFQVSSCKFQEEAKTTMDPHG
jgi:hypothetical protein